MPNTDKKLIPGLYANVMISVGEPIPATLIPGRAILTDQDRKYIYVMDENNIANKRYVIIGKAYGKMRNIISGISADERVIVSGLQQIYASGTQVSPNPVHEDENYSINPFGQLTSLSD